MSKRKYILKRQDLYNSSTNDYILEKAVRQKEGSLAQNSLIQKQKNQPYEPEINQEIQYSNFNLTPITQQDPSNNQFLPSYEHTLQPSKINNPNNSDSNPYQQQQKKYHCNKNPVASKKPNSSIAFSSSFSKAKPIKNLNLKTNRTKSNSKSKSITSHNTIKDKSISKISFSQTNNFTARSASGKKKNIKKQILIQNQEQTHQNQEQRAKPTSIQITPQEQCLQLNSMITTSMRNQQNSNHQKKDILTSDHLTTKKQKGSITNQSFLKNIDSQLHFLSTQLKNSQQKNQQLQEILASRQAKIDEQHQQSIRLYKQNKDLSDMIRDLEQLMNKKSIQYQKTIFESGTQLKQTQNQCKILQAERDTLLRKKDRLNQEISKLYETIQLKDAQILSLKQQQEFLISQNKSLATTYQTIKHELQQAIKINQTQRFFQQLVQKTQQQTARNNLGLSTFQCSQCHQTIYGNQNTCNQLANYHMNEKFKKHIKTYENQVKYWKDEVQFMKTQHQHQIQNIKTVLQCTFQKNLIEKQTKFSQETGQLKKTILIQEELIQNYKNVINRKQKTIKQDIKNQTQRSHSVESKQKVKRQVISPRTQRSRSIESKKETKSLMVQNVETARSRSYLTDRQVIEEVLAEEQEYRPRRNTAVIRMKQSNANFKDSLKNSSLIHEGQNSIFQTSKRKNQLSQSNFNSRITRVPLKQREPLSERYQKLRQFRKTMKKKGAFKFY